jgi:2-oxoglutarate dehydrogenase E1 component
VILLGPTPFAGAAGIAVEGDLMTPTVSLARASTAVARGRSTAPARAPETLQRSPLAQAAALINAHRLYGYRQAAINPLHDSASLEPIPELDPATHGFVPEEYASQLEVEIGGVTRTLTVAQLLGLLRNCYCGALAINSQHLRHGVQRDWLHLRLERSLEVPAAAPAERVRILGLLCATEIFEQYLATRYAGLKRFNLEGAECIVPLLDALIHEAIRHRVDNVILGMQHRGRLNLMKNALGAPAEQVLSLLSGTPNWPQPAWDLNDHLGYSTEKQVAHGAARIQLVPNPSHLESVSPVVCGIARALQDRRGDAAMRVLPLLVHGDAAFCGQGILAETLNLSQIRGYQVGGTVHVILNNQIGSTVSLPADARSSLSCADVGRAIDAPILHVNADDPEAVCFAAKLAIDYRMEFGADVIVDLIGYRRYGHNSADEVALTQPAMQRKIQNHRQVVDIYAERLIEQGVVSGRQVAEMRSAAWEEMCEAEARLPGAQAASSPTMATSAPGGAARSALVNTAVPLSHLQMLLRRLTEIPAHVSVHAALQNLMAIWRDVAKSADAAVDWCIAENLAYATLLANGFNLRLTGMDVGRGSFYHRHAVWHDQSAEIDGVHSYVPLRSIAAEQGSFSIFDTPLSEEAVLGFEYGYATQCGRDLVLWEAQFGDFVNNAQVIIDQYIACGAAKWGYRNALVMLLPHGHEGVGPEHSSASIVRFLSLCAEDNMRVAMPTSSAQLFHLLRRQALAEDRRPLVVMTGKMCLLNQRASHSPMREFANGRFHALLESPEDGDAESVTHVVATSGKLYYDLSQARQEAKRDDVALLRVEELYPFPRDALGERLARYPRLAEVVWAQEEARNHGAWHFVREEIEAALPRGVTLRYAGRSPSAASAVCNAAQHAAEQRAIIAEALSSLAG